MTLTPPPDSEASKQEFLRRTVETELASLPLAAADAPLRFTERLLMYLREWVAEHPDPVCARDDAAVFIFSEYPRLEAEECDGFESVPLFEDTLERPMLGHVHLCTTGVAEVHRRELASTTSAAALAYLEERGWERRPTLVFYPRRSLARFYTAGLRNEAKATEFSLAAANPAVTAEEIEETIERFYDVYVRTPNPTLRVWHNPNTHVPVEHAEKMIQDGLASLLRATLSSDCLVSPEWSVDLTRSRADIGILPKPGATGEWSVIEVKVLRSRWHSGRPCPDLDNATAVADGIDQAIEYRNRTAAQHAYLCCYDLRRADDDTICAPLRPKAVAERVRLERYYVHNSSKTARRNRSDSAYGLLRGTRPLGKSKPKQ